MPTGTIYDTWQDEAHTNRVSEYGIAIGTAGDAPDVSDIPLGGKMVTWESGWTPISVYFTDDDVDLEAVDEQAVEINPPTAPGLIALIRDKIGIRRIRFTSQEVGAKLMQYATNMSEVDPVEGTASPGSGYWVESQEHTRVSVAVEVRGLGIVWCPSCEIKVLPIKGNVKKPATEEVVIDVFCVTTGGLRITNAFLEYKAE
jgi:hypothetical protein